MTELTKLTMSMTIIRDVHGDHDRYINLETVSFFFIGKQNFQHCKRITAIRTKTAGEDVL